MDFLIICIFVLIVAIISRFFFKTILIVSLIGIFGFLLAPNKYKIMLNNEMVKRGITIKSINQAINGILKISETAAVKLTKKN